MRQLRQMTLSEVLNGAFSICREHFGELVRIVAVVLVPAQLVTLVALLAAPDGTVDLLLGTSDPDDTIDGASVVAVLVSTTLSAFASLLATAAAFRFVSDSYLGIETGWRESLSYALRRLHSILWILLLAGLGIAAGFLLLILPGFFIAVAWALAIPVLLSEDARGSKALGRSYRLVRGNWWKTFGTLILAGIIVGLVQSALSAVVTLAVDDSDSKVLEAVLATLLYLVLYLVSIPFTTTVLTLIYFDLRVRKDGVDIAMEAEGAGVDVAMVRRFLERRESLDPGARRSLAAQLAGKIDVAGVERGDDDERFLEAFAGHPTG